MPGSIGSPSPTPTNPSITSGPGESFGLGQPPLVGSIQTSKGPHTVTAKNTPTSSNQPLQHTISAIKAQFAKEKETLIQSREHAVQAQKTYDELKEKAIQYYTTSKYLRFVPNFLISAIVSLQLRYIFKQLDSAKTQSFFPSIGPPSDTLTQEETTFTETPPPDVPHSTSNTPPSQRLTTSEQFLQQVRTSEISIEKLRNEIAKLDPIAQNDVLQLVIDNSDWDTLLLLMSHGMAPHNEDTSNVLRDAIKLMPHDQQNDVLLQVITDNDWDTLLLLMYHGMTPPGFFTGMTQTSWLLALLKKAADQTISNEAKAKITAAISLAVDNKLSISEPTSPESREKAQFTADLEQIVNPSVGLSAVPLVIRLYLKYAEKLKTIDPHITYPDWKESSFKFNFSRETLKTEVEDQNHSQYYKVNFEQFSQPNAKRIPTQLKTSLFEQINRNKAYCEHILMGFPVPESARTPTPKTPPQPQLFPLSEGNFNPLDWRSGRY